MTCKRGVEKKKEKEGKREQSEKGRRSESRERGGAGWAKRKEGKSKKEISRN